MSWSKQGWRPQSINLVTRDYVADKHCFFFRITVLSCFEYSFSWYDTYRPSSTFKLGEVRYIYDNYIIGFCWGAVLRQINILPALLFRGAHIAVLLYAYIRNMCIDIAVLVFFFNHNIYLL